MVCFRTLVFLVVVLLPAAGWARWEGPADNKKADQLEQLEIPALFNEAFEVCVRRAVLAATPKEDDVLDPVYFAAWDYLSIIEGVVRDKSGGHLPAWMRELSFAHTTKECQEIFRSFVEGDDISTETEPAQAASSPKPTAKPRVARPTPRPKPPVRKAAPRRTQAFPAWVEPPPRWIAPPTTTAPRQAAPTRALATPVPRATATLAPRPTRPRLVEPQVQPEVQPTTAVRAARPTPEITDELPPWLKPKR